MTTGTSREEALYPDAVGDVALEEAAYDYFPAIEGGTRTSTYLVLLLATACGVGLVGFISSFFGAFWLPLTVGGVALIILTIWRVEMGLFILAILIPWQLQTRLHPDLTLVKAVGIIVAVIGLLHLFASRGPRWPSMIKWAVALGTWAAITSIANSSSASDLIILQNNLIMMYLIMRFCSNRAALDAMFWAFAISSIGIALFGLAATLGAGYLSADSPAKLVARGVNANTYIRFMFPGIFLPLILIERTRNSALRIALLGGIAVCAITMLLVVARGGTAGAILGGLTVLLTTRKIGFRKKFLIIFVAGSLAVSSIFLASKLGARKGWEAKTEAKAVAHSAGWRFSHWRKSLLIALENPVLGVGMGNEGLAYIRAGEPATEAHNDLISAMVTTGILGFICFVAILTVWFRGLWRMPHGTTRSCLLGMWVALVITGLFNPSFRKKILWVSAGIAAAAIAYYAQIREQREWPLEEKIPEGKPA
ncbi:MAG: O-antigen ligase family protein [Planctomycetota bacterium]|jgi:O-antigen ligase